MSSEITSIEDLNEFLEGEGRREQYGSLEEVLDNNPLELSELLETGSVTLNMADRSFELSLNVKEIKS